MSAVTGNALYGSVLAEIRNRKTTCPPDGDPKCWWCKDREDHLPCDICGKGVDRKYCVICGAAIPWSTYGSGHDGATIHRYRRKRYCGNARCYNKAGALKKKKRLAWERSDHDCLRCRTMFTPTRSDGKYCSDACRVAAFREREKAKR